MKRSSFRQKERKKNNKMKERVGVIYVNMHIEINYFVRTRCPEKIAGFDGLRTFPKLCLLI